jgi:hypothetical protein
MPGVRGLPRSAPIKSLIALMSSNQLKCNEQKRSSLQLKVNLHEMVQKQGKAERKKIQRWYIGEHNRNSLGQTF